MQGSRVMPWVGGEVLRWPEERPVDGRGTQIDVQIRQIRIDLLANLAEQLRQLVPTPRRLGHGQDLLAEGEFRLGLTGGECRHRYRPGDREGRVGWGSEERFAEDFFHRFGQNHPTRSEGIVRSSEVFD